MNDAGINRCTSKSDENQSGHRGDFAKGKKQSDDAKENNTFAKTNHLYITEFYSHKTADCAADSNADKEETCQKCGCLCRQISVKYQIAARPQARGLFEGTITEKGNHNIFCPRNLKNLL